MDDKKKDYPHPERLHQRNSPNNYKPITCLPTMWNIVTAQIREEIYCSLISRKKRCRKGTRGTGELLYIEQHILNKSERRRNKSSYCVN